MSTWTTPKSNWTSRQSVTDQDMNRIEGNNEYLYDQIGPSAVLANEAKTISDSSLARIESVIDDLLFFSSTTVVSGPTWVVTTSEIPSGDLFTVSCKLTGPVEDNQMVSVNGGSVLPVFVDNLHRAQSGMLVGDPIEPLPMLIMIDYTLNKAFLLAAGTRMYEYLLNKPRINGNVVQAENTTASLGITAANTGFSSIDIPEATTVEEAILAAANKDNRKIGDMYFTGRQENPGANFLECNGQALDPVAYPELYDAIAGQYGDYTGEFRRQNIPAVSASNIPSGWQAANNMTYSAGDWVLVLGTTQAIRYNVRTRVAQLLTPALTNLRYGSIATDGMIIILANTAASPTVYTCPAGATAMTNVTSIVGAGSANNNATTSIARLSTGWVAAVMCERKDASYTSRYNPSQIRIITSVDGTTWTLRNTLASSNWSGRTNKFAYNPSRNFLTLMYWDMSRTPSNLWPTYRTLRRSIITLAANGTTSLATTDLRTVDDSGSTTSSYYNSQQSSYCWADGDFLSYVMPFMYNNTPSGGSLTQYYYNPCYYSIDGGATWMSLGDLVPIYNNTYISIGNIGGTYIRRNDVDQRIYLSFIRTPGSSGAANIWAGVAYDFDLTGTMLRRRDMTTRAGQQYTGTGWGYVELNGRPIIALQSSAANTTLFGIGTEKYGATETYYMEPVPIDANVCNSIQYMKDFVLYQGGTGQIGWLADLVQGFVLPAYNLTMPKCYIKARGDD